MIIECQACHARFRLDESRIKGKGARVRCRKCGESILVMKDEAPEPEAAAGQFDLNRAVGESLLLEPPAALPPEPAEPPAAGHFDISLAVEESMGRDDAFLDLGAVASPRPDDLPPAAEAIIPSLSEFPGLDASPGNDAPHLETLEAAPPVYETGVDPFAAAEPFPAPVAEPSEPPILMTGTPLELLAGPETAPPPAAPELDDVDLAFEQFLAGTDEGFALAAPGPEPTPAAAPAPPADEGLLDLSAPEPAAPPAGPFAAEEGPSSFLLNDAETLDFIGSDHPGPVVPQPAPQADSRADAFAFQLDEEALRIPDAPAPSPFTDPARFGSEPAGAEAPEATREQAPPPRQQPLPQELPVPKTALRGRQAKEPREPFVRPGVALLGALFVLLAGAGGYLGFTDGGRATLRQLVPAIGPLLGGDNAAKKGGPQFDVRNLIGYYDNTAKAGRMFVIKGQVANTGQVTKGRIRIHAALLDNTNKTLAEKTVYAGNVLGGEALRVADKETIEKTLSSPFGEKLANLDVAPGKAVPFMVVFLNIPEGIDAYRLEAKEGE